MRRTPCGLSLLKLPTGAPLESQTATLLKGASAFCIGSWTGTIFMKGRSKRACFSGVTGEACITTWVLYSQVHQNWLLSVFGGPRLAQGHCFHVATTTSFLPRCQHQQTEKMLQQIPWQDLVQLAMCMRASLVFMPNIESVLAWAGAGNCTQSAMLFACWSTSAQICCLSLCERIHIMSFLKRLLRPTG